MSFASLYRMLLRLLPRSYRVEERAEMLDTYQARTRRARAERGRLAELREHVAEVLDLVATVAVARWPLPSVDSVWQDLRTAVRSLSRSPLPSGLAFTSLALGIGATTAIFSVLDVWLIRPLPLPNADRLVAVGMANRDRGWLNNPFSLRDYHDWSRASESVKLMAHASGSFNLLSDGRAERVDALQVSVNALEVLGIDPALGRAFRPEDGTPGASRVTLLTHSFWRDWFGSETGVVGTPVILDGLAYTVLGVLPEGQGIPGDRADLWVPLRISGDEPREGHFLWGVGLLQPGFTVESAQPELDAVAGAVAEQDPRRTFPHALARPYRDSIYQTEYRQGGLILGASALFVLLIACANIANILLARGLGRSHELAVRGTLGAGRGRIMQQLMVENGLTALIGGLAGIGVGHVSIKLLLTYVLPPEDVVGWSQIGLDARVLAGAGCLTVLSVLAFGLIPAMRTSRIDLRHRLAEGGRDGALGSRSRLVPGLVVAEISATLVLVVLSALMVRSLVAMRSVDLEMTASDAIVFQLDVPSEAQPTWQGVASFYADLEERLTAHPGVTGLATTSGHILTMWSTTLYSVSGSSPEDDDRLSAELRRVSPSYLDVLGLDMVAGRWFDPAIDGAEAPRVAVVSRRLASLWWDDASEALGEVLEFSGRSSTIIGVVDPGRLRGPHRDPPPAIFEAFPQSSTRSTFNVLAHTMDDPEAVALVRETVRDLDPDLAIFDVQSIEATVDEALGAQKAGLRLLGALGALALTLTLVGVYGVMAHSVGRRMQEMGLRMALGADGGSLIRMILTGNAKLAAIGVGLGLLLSLGAGQGIAFLLEGVSPRDPVVLASATLSLFAAIFAASYLPARRAALADPVKTLRRE